MVSVVPSIIPILTANAVAANQPKKQKKVNVSKEKKLKDSPLNDKVNCRVFLNNGNVIEGHYEGNWYEDNSDEEGIWIKTDNGTEEINSKDYDRVQYYHKKPLKEAYIKGENGNVYYTKNNEMFLSMIKSIFISKNIPVRVYFDTIKQLYVFGNAFGYIHADLATSMKYYSKIYGTDEMRANISYLKQNCALFQVLPDDDFKKYDVGDGYTKGRFLILDGLIFACREKEYGKVRDNVPLFNGHIGEWQDVQYYEYKKSQQTVNESVEEKILYIIRGVPGSGKSTLAHKLTDNVVEADQYFYDDKGNYNWSADKLNQAHNWCFNTVKKYMEEGRDKIAVANTFVKKRDYKRYVELAEQFGYKVDIRVCNGNFKNIHGVPDETVEKMRAKFQLDESIIYVSKKDLSDIILKNPTRKELKEYKINNWRILQDIQGNYYFADAMKYIHQQMSNKLNSKGIEAVDAETDNAGIVSYNILTNTFYYRLLDLLDEKDIKKEYNNSYLSKEFPNAELKRSNDDVEELDESVLNDKVFYTKRLSRMLNICLNIGNARFIYIPEANLYVIGDAHNNTHISLFISALNEGKFDIGENDIDEYFDEYINSAEDTGAIITKEYANDKNVWLKSPDSTNVINDYGKFYLCNGLCIEESLAELTKSEPKYVKRKSYLDESIAFVSKKDLSDIILKNPTKRELRENNLTLCRCIEDSEGNWYFTDMENMLHAYVVYELRDEASFPLFDGNDCYGIAYYDAESNEFWFNLNDYMYKKECIEQYNNSEYLRTTFPNARVIPNPWNNQMYDELYDDDEQLDESAENDKTLRDYAVKLANICLDALVKTKYETKIAGSQIQINVDKAFKKAVPMLKKSSYEYFILLVSKKEDKNASYGKTVDKKYGLITLPIFSDDPIDQTLSILTKHKAVLNRIYSTYHGDELKWKLNEYAIKYLKKEIEKMLVNLKSEYIDILIHECTHLIDDVRRTKTYKSKDQNLKDDNGIENYYNSPEEQNAFYQETISMFDEWAKDVGYKSFDIFFDDFVRQYKGEWNMLNEKNKRKLKKRAYAYWELYIKE